MKVILLGDLHMGARSGDLDFAKYFNLFFTDVLFPYMEKHGIDTIVQAGDYFDNQTKLVYDAWKICKPVWVEHLIKKQWKMFVLVGNHDIAYRNTLEVNSPNLILSEYAPHISVISEPTTLDFDGYSFDVVPWICSSNKDKVEKFIKEQRGSALIGHFAIEGFPMYKNGQVEKKGMKQELFDGYPFVFSGHFHTHSTANNITYLGVPYEITWSDFDDPKGFHVFDTETQTSEFVVNPNKMFEKLLYTEGMSTDFTELSNKIVRLLVTDRGDLKKYTAFTDLLKVVNTKSLDIVESVVKTEGMADVDVGDIDWIEDTTGYIKKVVDSIETDLDKDSVSSYLVSLHNRAISI